MLLHGRQAPARRSECPTDRCASPGATARRAVGRGHNRCPVVRPRVVELVAIARELIDRRSATARAIPDPQPRGGHRVRRRRQAACRAGHARRQTRHVECAGSCVSGVSAASLLSGRASVAPSPATRARDRPHRRMRPRRPAAAARSVHRLRRTSSGTSDPTALLAVRSRARRTRGHRQVANAIARSRSLETNAIVRTSTVGRFERASRAVRKGNFVV